MLERKNDSADFNMVPPKLQTLQELVYAAANYTDRFMTQIGIKEHTSRMNYGNEFDEDANDLKNHLIIAVANAQSHYTEMQSMLHVLREESIAFLETVTHAHNVQQHPDTEQQDDHSAEQQHIASKAQEVYRHFCETMGKQAEVIRAQCITDENRGLYDDSTERAKDLFHRLGHVAEKASAAFTRLEEKAQAIGVIEARDIHPTALSFAKMVSKETDAQFPDQTMGLN